MALPISINNDPNFPPTGAGPYRIDRTWCLGDTLPYLNGNTTIFANEINSLGTALASTSANLVTGYTTLVNSTSSNLNNQISETGKVLQVVAQTTDLSQLGGAITSITDTGIPALTLTRKSTTSKILIDLIGGRAYTNSLAPARTYFYIQLNGSGSYVNIDGSGRSVEYLDSSTQVWTPHSARYFYTPISTTTTISLKVYYSISTAASTFWHHVGTTAEPFILTMSEIA
jgi:hypothetical protein